MIRSNVQIAPVVAGAISLVSFTASSSTYYVSVSGNDSNAGTMGAPWRTVQKAANTLAPGDTAYVRAGTYNERVTVNVSGSAAGFVTFQSFPGETAVLDGTGLTVPDEDNGMFLISSQNYIAIRGFELQNYHSSANGIVPAGIFVTGSAHDIMVQSNLVHDIGTSYPGTDGGDAFAIAFYGTSTQPMTNIVVQGNEVYNMTTGSSETVTFNGNVANFSVVGNLIHDNENIGIDFIGYENTCPDPNQDRARNGVCLSNVVWNISSYGNPAYGDQYGADGIYCDGASNVVVAVNQIYLCDIGLEMASEHSGHSASGIQAHDNMIWSNRVVGIYIGGYDQTVGRTEFCTITHNTLYHNDTLQQGNGEWGVQFDTRTNTFTENILVPNSQNIFISNGYTQNTNNLVDWNLYYSAGGASGSDWEWRKTDYGSFTSYKSGTTNDAHSLFANPLFVNEAAANFHLQVTSPAVNAGDPNFTPAPGETDIDGQSRVADGRTDIGADELVIFTPTLGIQPGGSNTVVIQLTGEPGHNFLFQQSGGLSGWKSFLTNAAPTGSLEVTNPVQGSGQFYRARMVQ